MYATPVTSPTNPAVDLTRYSTPIAALVAVLVIVGLVVRIVSTPLALAVLVIDRIGGQLDRWLAALPTPPQPVHANAARLAVISLTT